MSDDHSKPVRIKTNPGRDFNRPRTATPRNGVPTPVVFDEDTDIHGDGQAFRAVKALRGEMLAANEEAKRSHGDLEKRVTELNETVATAVSKVAEVAENHAEYKGKLDTIERFVVESVRSKTPSNQQAAIQQAVDGALAQREQEKQKNRISLRHKLIIAAASAAFTFIGAALSYWLFGK